MARPAAVDGRSIHRYRLQLRLARCLDRVAGGDRIEAVAHELGFSSHSHFTAAFHRAYDRTPAQFRRRASGALLRSMLGV